MHNKPIQHIYLYICDPLFNFLVRGVGARLEDAFGQVMDETDPLGNADLLLLSELVRQATLPRGGMVHLHRLGALLEGKQPKTTPGSYEASLLCGRI